jgi:hypothetical protein
MLSRINLTLSALTNRLNLGTRTLVLNASGNNGKTTLRIRHLHHDVMRQRMVWCVVPSFQSQSYDIPPMPGSIIPGPQQRPIRCAGQDASRSACQRRVQPKPSQAWLLKQARPGRHPLESMSARAARNEGSDWGYASGQARWPAAAARAAVAAA